MAVKTHYELLEIAPTAPFEEIKRAFRQQIARYHPDKVQHLGREFQDMAADRAAELTEAYRVLSDEKRRAEYDQKLSADTTAATPIPAPASSPAAPPPTSPPPQPAAAPPPPDAPPHGPQFSHERATKDEFVRRALLSRLRQALDVVACDYDTATVRGFDFACNPKSKLFSRSTGPRLLGRFVPRVDSETLADTWMQAAKAAAGTDELCIFLMGPSVAPRPELAAAIAEQRRKTRGKKLTVIPVDTNDWEATMPHDAPAIAKVLIKRLRDGV